MANPITPNFIPGVGQLTTSRYDFQKHIDGINEAPNGPNFRHTAIQIDLTSPILGAATVQQALINIVSDLNPVIPQATIGYATENLGLITLGGDLQGTATNPVVVKLRGIDIANIVPINNQVLQFIQSTGKWTPSSAAFTLTGDVTGTFGATIVSAINSSVAVPINASLNLNAGKIITLTASSLLEVGAYGYISVQNNGGIEVQSGGAIQLNSGSALVTYGGTIQANGTAAVKINNAGGLVLEAANDFVQYGIPHTRTIWNTFSTLTLGSGWAHAAYWLTSTNAGNSVILKLDNLHNGATLSSLNISFEVASSHSYDPQFFPTIVINRVHLQTNINSTLPLSSTGGSPISGYGATYGSPQQFTLTCIGTSSDNVIDTSNYIYYLVLTDESGTNSITGNIYYGYSVHYTNITTDQFP